MTCRSFFMYFLVAVGLLTCTGTKPNDPNNNHSGTASETGNVTCKLVYPNGNPVTQARIKILPSDTIADTASLGLGKVFAGIDTTLTSDSGIYYIDSVDSGTYVVQAADNDSNAVLIDSVVVTHLDSLVDLGTDTLEPVGAIKAVVKLSEGGDPRKVFILAFGTDRYALPDANGVFTFGNLAEGTYKLRLISSLDDYAVLDTAGVLVISDSTTDLDTLELPFTGIPTPKGLSASYDTLTGVVTLAWNALAYDSLDGYIVYRNDTASTTPVKISGSTVVRDTVYRDTVFSDLLDSNSHVFDYRIRAQAKNANVGDNYSKSVEITATSPRSVRTFLTLTTAGTRNDTASIHDTVNVIVAYSNQTRKNNSLFWYVDHPESLVAKVDVSDAIGNDTLKYAWPDSGAKKAYVKAKDSGGSFRLDSVSIQILQDPPTVNAGNDTTVLFGTTVTLAGNAFDAFGDVVKYEWDLDGDGSSHQFIETSTSDTSFIPNTAGWAYFKATDDDGNSSSDSVRIAFIVWSSKASLGLPGFSHSCQLNGKIYSFNGNTNDSMAVEEYDIASDSWIRKSSLSSKKAMAACAVSGGIYVITSTPSTIEKYDPISDTWTTKSQLPTSRDWFSCTAVGGKIYVIGGVQTNPEVFSTTVEEYDPASDIWTTRASMDKGRQQMTSCAVGEKIYVLGGWNSQNGYLNTVEEYDPSSNTWTTKTGMPTPRKSLSSAVVQDKIYAFGGYSGVSLDVVEQYDPAKDRWTSKTPTPSPRYGSSSIALDSLIFLIGGENIEPVKIVEQYRPTLDP